jgi:hypothetical protein
MQFIRVYNSDGGYSDVSLSTAAKVLASNGTSGTDAPTFEYSAGERLRHTFSYTQRWEKAILDNYGGNDYGIGNFTAEFERSLGTGDRYGPSAWTTPGDHPFSQRV